MSSLKRTTLLNIIVILLITFGASAFTDDTNGIGFYRYHYGRTKHRVFAEIAHMRDLAEQNDALFAVAILPIFSHKQATWRFDNYILADVHAEVLDNLRARNVEVIDTLPTFQALGRPPRAVSSDPWHPNREGHAVIAEALVGPVLELLH